MNPNVLIVSITLGPTDGVNYTATDEWTRDPMSPIAPSIPKGTFKEKS